MENNITDSAQTTQPINSTLELKSTFISDVEMSNLEDNVEDEDKAPVLATKLEHKKEHNLNSKQTTHSENGANKSFGKGTSSPDTNTTTTTTTTTTTSTNTSTQSGSNKRPYSPSLDDNTEQQQSNKDTKTRSKGKKKASVREVHNPIDSFSLMYSVDSRTIKHMQALLPASILQ